MAENATPAKIAATKAYGAEVVLHGTIWDEANEKAKELGAHARSHVRPSVRRRAADRRAGHARPRDRLQDWPEVDAVVVPIGGGGLISGVSMAVKSHNPKIEGHRRRVVRRARR